MTSSKQSEYHNVSSFLSTLNIKKESYFMFQDVATLKNIIHIWYIYKYELSNIILSNKLQFLVDVILNSNIKKHKTLVNTDKQYEWSHEFESFYSMKYSEIIGHISEIRAEIENNYAKIDEGFKIIIELESSLNGSIDSDKLNVWFKKFTNLMIYDYKYTVLKIDEDILSEEIAFLKFLEGENETWNYNLLLFDSSSWHKDLLEMFSAVNVTNPDNSAVYIDMENDLLNQLKELLTNYLNKECEYSLSILTDLEDVIDASKVISNNKEIDGRYTDQEQLQTYNKKKLETLTKIYNFSFIYTLNGTEGKVGIQNKLTTLLKFGYTALTSNKCYEVNMLNKANIYDKNILHERLLSDLMYYNNCPCCKFFNLFAPIKSNKPFEFTHISRRVNLHITGLSNMNFVFLDNTDVIGASSVVIESNSYLKLSNVMKQIFDIPIGDFIIPDRVNHIPASSDPIPLNYFIERNSALKQLWSIVDSSNNETDMFLCLPYGPEKSSVNADYKKPTFEESCQYVKNMISIFINDRIREMGFPAVLMADDDLIKNKIKYSASKKDYLYLTELSFTPSSDFYKSTEAFLL